MSSEGQQSIRERGSFLGQRGREEEELMAIPRRLRNRHAHSSQDCPTRIPPPTRDGGVERGGNCCLSLLAPWQP